MSERRYYSAGTEEALHLLSGGGCYRPGCGEPTIRFDNGAPKKNVEVAHIHAFEKNGPREIPTMSKRDRNSFANLVLLCGICHKVVDGDEKRYPAVLLKQWKADRESKPRGSLAGLRDLDRDSMEKLLDDAMADLREEMVKVAQMFPELAELLRNIIEGVPPLDPDSVGALSVAARQLGLPDHAPQLAMAARQLGLPDYAPQLAAAARSLALQDTAPQLAQAARSLEGLPDLAYLLKGLIQQLDQRISALGSAADSISDSAGEVEAATDGLTASQLPNFVVRHSDRYWQAMLFGWAGWGVVLLIAVIYVMNTKGQ